MRYIYLFIYLCITYGSFNDTASGSTSNDSCQQQLLHLLRATEVITKHLRQSDATVSRYLFTLHVSGVTESVIRSTTMHGTMSLKSETMSVLRIEIRTRDLQKKEEYDQDVHFRAVQKLCLKSTSYFLQAKE